MTAEPHLSVMPFCSAELLDPPFYHAVFENAYRFIIDDYTVIPEEIAIFFPCAIKKKNPAAQARATGFSAG